MLQREEVRATLTATGGPLYRDCEDPVVAWTHPESGANLLIGSVIGVSHYARLHAMGVGAIVSLAYTPLEPFYILMVSPDEDAVQKHLFVWHVNDTHDTNGTNVYDALDGIWAFVYEHLRAGVHVLIHCLAGVSRSGAVTWAMMARLGGDPLDEAKRLRAARPCLAVNPYLADQVLDWFSGERLAEKCTVLPANGNPAGVASDPRAGDRPTP